MLNVTQQIFGWSKLELAGIVLPAASDRSVSISVRPISQSSDIRRTVNGDAVNVGRAVYQRYAISVSCSDLHPAGLSELFPGTYIEATAPAPWTLSLSTPSTFVSIPRASVEVAGILSSGETVQPVAQPTDLRATASTYSTARVSELRTPQSVTFQSPVIAVRYRPILACMLTATSWSQDESEAESSWSVELEEI